MVNTSYSCKSNPYILNMINTSHFLLKIINLILTFLPSHSSLLTILNISHPSLVTMINISDPSLVTKINIYHPYLLTTINTSHPFFSTVSNTLCLTLLHQHFYITFFSLFFVFSLIFFWTYHLSFKNYSNRVVFNS